MTNSIDKYFITEESLPDLINKDDTYIVFDTNVLLAAYQWRRSTKEQIENIINKFYVEGKLKYSLQVIQEFSKNRSMLIRERIDDISEAIAQQDNITPLKRLVPILSGEEIFKETEKIQEEYIKSLNNYREQLKVIKKELSQIFREDTFLKLVYESAKTNIIKEYSDEELCLLKQEAKNRYENNIPPGYTDKNKSNRNEYGDFILWNDLMNLKSNVILVSNDEKSDWCLKNKDGQVLLTNPELLKEFFERTEGKNFLHVSLFDFVKYLNENVNQEVLADLSESAFEDTIVVPARDKGFTNVFLGQKQWYDIRISEQRMRNLKYIAVYQVAPKSAITYYAKIKEIIDSDNIAGYKKVIFDGEAIKLERPIILGENVYLAPQGSRYVFFSKLKNSYTLEDLFD